MAGRKGSDFLLSTKRVLAGRAGFKCSYPACRLFTIGPHTDEDRTVSVGVAAHIHGAAPGSARYDEKQTPEQRRHISNGIWMCQNHATIIDNDEIQYPPKLLYDWKAEREGQARTEYGTTSSPGKRGNTLDRPEQIYRLETDLTYKFRDLVVSYDPWKCFDDSVTMVKLSVEGEFDENQELDILAACAVKAYLAHVGLRGNYLHIFSKIRNLKHKIISRSYPKRYESQYNEFQDWLLGIDWSSVPGIEGTLQDVVAGDVLGTGEWSTFMFDITPCFPTLFADQ